MANGLNYLCKSVFKFISQKKNDRLILREKTSKIIDITFLPRSLVSSTEEAQSQGKLHLTKTPHFSMSV